MLRYFYAGAFYLKNKFGCVILHYYICFMNKEEFKTLKVHPDLHRKLKKQSARTGISIYALGEIAIKIVTNLSYGQLESIVMADFANESHKLLDGMLNPKKQLSKTKK